MLFDPKWGKADPFKFNTLIEWLKSRNQSDTYQYSDCTRCLLSQYFADHGFAGIQMGQTEFRYFDDLGLKQYSRLPKRFDEVARGPYPVPDRDTYGSALQRALASKRKVK